MKKILVISVLLSIVLGTHAEVWPAQWIGTARDDSQQQGLHAAYFRKCAALERVPAEYIINVTADNRYKLYVNGRLASWGPARSNQSNWNYETVNIAPFLHQGENTLAAVVWNYGDKRPVAQMGTNEIGFLLRVSEGNPVFNTDTTWQVLTDAAYKTFDDFTVPGYFAARCGEHFDAANYPWGWETGDDSSDGQWQQARQTEQAFDKGERDRWGHPLVPRSIPQMEMKEVSAGHISLPITIRSHQHKTILIDRDSLTTAYLRLMTSGGKGARIEVCYAEALFNPDMPDLWHATKPQRNETNGKVMMGNKDVFLPDGGVQREMTTLWWRTWRYLQLTVETADEPLTIDNIGAVFTAYPLKKESRLEAGEEFRRMEEIGWRTARLCANETYMDCPYYEQLQYFGDARIQAMITMYNTRDSLMPHHAIEQGRMSMTADGITQSRYPSSFPQMISSYSLSWIGMLYDYWMMRGQEQWLRQYLPAARNIIGWYEGFLRDDMSLSRVPHWFFADWAEGFQYGEPNYGQDGSAAYQDLVLILALQELAAMEKDFGIPALGTYYTDLAGRMADAVRKKYWNQEKGLFADTLEQTVFSQHVNILAILADVVKGEEARVVCQRILDDQTLIQVTFYFRYFLQLAMDKTGLGDLWPDALQPWRDQLVLGLTTWAETPEPTRSDCHAWSASPNVEFYRMLLGIHSAAPGFSRVLISPALGSLTEVSGFIPHPQGTISVKYRKKGKLLHADITLPPALEGIFRWNGKEYPIKAATSLDCS